MATSWFRKSKSKPTTAVELFPNTSEDSIIDSIDSSTNTSSTSSTSSINSAQLGHGGLVSNPLHPISIETNLPEFDLIMEEHLDEDQEQSLQGKDFLLTNEQILSLIIEDYYTPDFDPVNYELASIPEEWNSTQFPKEILLKEKSLQLIENLLLNKVVLNSDKFVLGMTQIMDIQQTVTHAAELCNIGIFLFLSLFFLLFFVFCFFCFFFSPFLLSNTLKLIKKKIFFNKRKKKVQLFKANVLE